MGEGFGIAGPTQDPSASLSTTLRIGLYGYNLIQKLW